MRSSLESCAHEVSESLPLKIGPYQILQMLGSGGMAKVFLGRATGQGGFERLVAIKQIRTELAGSRSYRRMFLDEARVAASLHHSAIVQVFDLGHHEGLPYLVMEYVHGVGLARIHRHLSFNSDPRRHLVASHVIARICAGLAHAHDRRDHQGSDMGIVHRDVSLQNVRVSFEGDVKLLDFGIVKAHGRLDQTRGEWLKGKLSYMAPEVLQRHEADRRADLYACGLVLHECLTGKRLFRGRSDRETLELVLRAETPPPSSVAPDVPPELDRICQKAMAREPADRYQTAVELQRELDHICFEAGFGQHQLHRFMGDAFGQSEEQQQVDLQMARRRLQDRLRRYRAGLRSEMARTTHHVSVLAVTGTHQPVRRKGETIASPLPPASLAPSGIQSPAPASAHQAPRPMARTLPFLSPVLEAQEATHAVTCPTAGAAPWSAVVCVAAVLSYVGLLLATLGITLLL